MASTINASTSSGLVQSADTSGNLNLQSNGTTVVAVTSTGASVTGLLAGSTNYTGFKNRIINGGMVIDQRKAGASVTPINGQYTLDRWQAGVAVSSTYSVQQSSIAPTGFSKSLLVTSLAATSIVASSYYSILQPIEGFNSSDFGFGTASASTVTISFWVRSSLTGTFGGFVENSNVDRSYPFSYIISAANTWEQKTVTVAGDTTGTWVGATNGAGIYLGFSLGMGSTRQGTANTWQAGNYRSVTGETPIVGTSGATFYITGVQLEKGSTATSFDYRPYGQELALCQRYYYKALPGGTGLPYGLGFNNSTTVAKVYTAFLVPMRSAPSALETTGTASDYHVRFTGDGTTNCSSAPTYADASNFGGTTSFTVASGLIGGQAVSGRNSATGGVAYLAWSAEL
jgi:hypothetical protein